MTVDYTRTADDWLELVLDLEKRVSEFAWTPFNWCQEDYDNLEAELLDRVQEATRLVDSGLSLHDKAWPRVCQYCMCRGYADANPDDPSKFRTSIPCLDAPVARRRQLLPPLSGDAS